MTRSDAGDEASDRAGDATDDLLGYVAASPSPYHAAAVAARALDAAGFTPADPTAVPSAPDAIGGRYVLDGGALLAWWTPPAADPTTGFVVLGAHTDSPNLRLKPRPDTGSAGWRQVGVDVYGGALVNSWLDRDLGLSGRIAVRTGAGVEMRLVQLDRPLLRVAQLAIHLDRDVNDGLRLDRQTQLTPLWGLGDPQPGRVAALLADAAGADPEQILSWDVMTHDVTPPARLGVDGELIAAGRLDNLAGCWAAVDALVATTERDGGPVAVMALFDHEEIGSTSAAGAVGPSLARTLERSVGARGGGRGELLAALGRSWCVSIDMAHAVHPNYRDRYEPEHLVWPNAGPVIKHNANHRYATDAVTAARFEMAAASAGVPVQHYSHRSNLPCGSTIGPLTAANVGMPTVDVGTAMLSMHSARELAGADDPALLGAALRACLEPR